MEWTTIGCIFEVDINTCEPCEYQDGTPAYAFPSDGTMTVSAASSDGVYGGGQEQMPTMAAADASTTIVFEPATSRAPMVDAPRGGGAWNVDTMVNIVAMLLLLSLGGSMLMTSGQPRSDDDVAFFVGALDTSGSDGSDDGSFVVAQCLCLAC